MCVFKSVHTFAYEGQYMFRGWKKGLKLSYVMHFNVILFVLYGRIYKEADLCAYVTQTNRSRYV